MGSFAFESATIIANQADFLHYLTNSEELLNTLLENLGGWMLAVVALIIFIESGVLFPVLPGDALIFTLGIIHLRIPNIPIWLTFITLFGAAILGNNVGYWLGSKYGRGLFKPEAKFLTIENREKAEEFFAKHGGKALLMARFVPFVRTFVPIVCGITQYRYKSFLFCNILGAMLWIGILLFAGVFLGTIPFIAKNIEIIATIVVLVSLLPIFIEYLRHRGEKKRAE